MFKVRIKIQRCDVGIAPKVRRNFMFNLVTSSIQTNQECKEVRDRSAEDEKVENEVVISFESAD